ncbi:DUF257 family protein [Thermococcus sp.]|uniref:DUF257 family protein n=1 Tax=Thermococcus sp. TaxID=35749 RepID=UPI002621C6C8|nr:DUF257 family protein [Thermococcus sp.]
MMKLYRPVLTTPEDVEDLFSRLWPGGVVLIENRSTLGAEFILSSFVHLSRNSGKVLIIEDIFDTLPLYTAHLDLMGVGVDWSEVRVIKVGGSREVGNVVGRIRFENNPYVYQKKLEEQLERAKPSGPYVHLVLGLERLLALQEGTHNAYSLFNLIRQKVGDEISTTVYLVEEPVVEGLRFNPLPMLEDVATSVVELTDEDELLRMNLRKSVFTLLHNRTRILLSAREIMRWYG